jgi:exodeoxyribonuclease VII small subunit
MPKRKTSFERSMQRLEEIVNTLEGKDFDLDGSLKLYEEGVGLSRQMLEVLNVASKKIKLLITKDSTTSIEDMTVKNGS